MRLIIDIPDEVYIDVKKAGGCYYDFGKAIVNGTPLPDNHGRLIDADELLINERPSVMSMIQWEDTHFYKTISDAPTVIESTKGE